MSTQPAVRDHVTEPPRRRRRGWTPAHTRWAGIVTGAALVLLVAVGLALRHDEPAASRAVTQTETAAAVGWGRPAVSARGLASRSGVTITQVAVTGGGGLVDLRFQVVDPDQAATLHDPQTPPAVVDEKTGLVIHQLFMDHAHAGPFTAGETYYYIFNNPGDWVQRGSRVTVLLGDAEVEHVVVR